MSVEGGHSPAKSARASSFGHQIARRKAIHCWSLRSVLLGVGVLEVGGVVVLSDGMTLCPSPCPSPSP